MRLAAQEQPQQTLSAALGAEAAQVIGTLQCGMRSAGGMKEGTGWSSLRVDTESQLRDPAYERPEVTFYRAEPSY